MKNLKYRAAVILLITMMCFSILLSTNIFKITPVKGYSAWGGFSYPSDVFVDSAGYVYVADTLNARVLKFDSNGIPQTFTGITLNHPYGIGGDANYIYVANTYTHQIAVFTHNGDFQGWIGNIGGGTGGSPGTNDIQFNYPWDVAADNSGNIYVSDHDNSRVQKIDTTTGNLVWIAGNGRGSNDTQFNLCFGIACDPDGYVYVCDGNNRVQELDPIGNFYQRWGTFGYGNGQFNAPTGIAVKGTEVYVADMGNHRIQKFFNWPPLGYVGSFIWEFGSQGSGQGQFVWPYGVDLDSAQNSMYVADTSNNRIQKFDMYNLHIDKVDPSGVDYNYVLPYEGDGKYPEGSVVTLTAFATSGYIFSYWSGDLTGIDNPTTITMNGAKAVTANFALPSGAIFVHGNPASFGQPVTFYGQGFPANNHLIARVTDPEGNVVTTPDFYSSTVGTFNVAFSPSIIGSYSVEIIDYTGSVFNAVWATATFSVTLSSLSFMPNPAIPTQQIEISGAVYPPGGYILDILVFVPDGRSVTLGPIPTDSNGEYTYDLPTEEPFDLIGTYSVWVRNLDTSEVVVAGDFVVRQPEASLEITPILVPIGAPVHFSLEGMPPYTYNLLVEVEYPDESWHTVGPYPTLPDGTLGVDYTPPSVPGTYYVEVSDSATQFFAWGYFDVAAPSLPQGLTVECIVDSPTPLTEDWTYSITGTDGNPVVPDFTLDANVGGTVLFNSATFTDGGVFTVTATPKYGYGTDVSVQTTVGSSYSINENGREATVTLATNGGAWVAFTNVKEAFGTAPASDPPPVGMASLPPFKVMPVQAAWNPNKNGLAGEVDLVAGKPTAVVVNVPGVASGTKLLLTFADAAPPPPNSPALPSPMELTVGDTTANSLVLFPPVNSPVILLDTLGTSRNVVIKVDYSSGSGPQPIESTTVTVRKTNDLSLYYCYLQKSGGQGYPAPSAQGFSDTVENSKTFMNQVYPVKNVAYTKGGAVNGAGTMLKDCMAVADQALKNGREIGVAVVSGERATPNDPKGYFEARGAPAGAVGVSYGPNFKGVVVAEGYWTAPAHEVGHTYNLYWEHPEEYLQKPDYGLGASGVNPSTSSAVPSDWRTGQDFMGVAPYQTFAKTWITNDGTSTDPDGTYNDLFKKFTQTLNDPETVIVSGIFHKDGTFEMPLTWSRVEQGTESQIVSGDYSLRFIGAAGTPEVDFDAQYYASYSMGVAVGKDAPSDSVRAGLGQVASDEAGFIFATELYAGTTEIQVLDPAAKTPTNPDGVVATVPASQIVEANAPTAYFTDADGNPISSFECVFTPDKSTGNYKMSATNPGTFCYNLKITNMDPTQTFTAVVNIPSDFTLKPPYPGASAVQVNGQPVAYDFNPGTGTLTVSNILVEEGHPKTLSVKLKYAPTRTFDSTAPRTFRQGYVFPARVNPADQPPVEQPPATITAVGKKVTAIGGFVTATSGFPKNGLTVKINGYPSQTTDADGFYFFELTTAGTYTVEVTNNQDPPKQLATANVKVSKDQFVEKDFNTLSPADPAITGFVVDAFGDGVAGVSVQLLDHKGRLFAATTTSIRGLYVFRISIPGEYTVKIAVPPGYNAAVTSTTLNVKQFETARVDFKLVAKP